MNTLIEWKNNKNRKPLLVYGARQVGKTYLIKEFGKTYFSNIIYVNFESNQEVNKIINTSIEPKYIIKEMEIIYNQVIDKENTLIFFDEIQKNPRAITSLKYFCENEPEYNVIGAGSLLGVHINRQGYSFPVGKVDIINVYPMDFEEFLIATNNDMLKNEIKKCYETKTKMENVLHEKALQLYNDYLIVGGMPEVVQDYVNNNSLISVVDIQTKIIESYKNDVTNYASPAEANKIIATFLSVPNQLAKDNKKFQYKLIRKGGSSSIFGYSIDWLVNSGIVNKCYKTNIGVPLKMYEELDSFKLYMNDVGLLVKLSEFPFYLIKNQEVGNELMIGMITENYVASSLLYNSLNLNYWKNDYSSEVDFILQTSKGLIIPLEVKSSIHTKSKSLNNYIKEYKPKFAIRVSSKNFGFNNSIWGIPLYALFCINKDNLEI